MANWCHQIATISSAEEGVLLQTFVCFLQFPLKNIFKQQMDTQNQTKPKSLGYPFTDKQGLQNETIPTVPEEQIIVLN